VKVNLKVWFCVIVLGELTTPAVSLVTVWGASVVLSHTTCVPILIDSVAGWKEYFSFCSTIFTITTVDFGVGVGLGVDVGVGVAVGGVVAVGVEVVAVVPPPHAAKKSTAIIANEKNPQDNFAFLANDDSFLIFMLMNLLTFQKCLNNNEHCMCYALFRKIRYKVTGNLKIRISSLHIWSWT